MSASCSRVGVSLEVAEVEFAMADCGSSGSETEVGHVMAGEDGDRVEGMLQLGGQGTAKEATEPEAMEFVATADGGFRPVSRAAGVRGTLDWQTATMDCGNGGLPWETFPGG